MKIGVKIGGMPIKPKVSWQWGYGWDESDDFVKLSPKKAKKILEKMNGIMNYIDTLPSDLIEEGLTDTQLQYIEEIYLENLKFLKTQISQRRASRAHLESRLQSTMGSTN